MRVAVLVPPYVENGRHDQEDTFVQAAEVSDCLAKLGHEVVRAEYADHGEGTASVLRQVTPDIVVNLVEEVPEGPDQLHLVTDLLDRLGIRYTGAKTNAIAALGDKRTMKQELRAAGLPTAPTLDDAPPDTTFIVKSASEHASFGLDAHSVVQGADAARQLISEKTATLGGEWFAETFIDGREFDLCILETSDGPRLLPLAEIAFLLHDSGQPKIFSYACKWDDLTAEFEATPRFYPEREEPLFSEIERIGLSAWSHFGLRGFSHIEFRVDAAGQPFVVEVNANPCLTNSAGFVMSAEEGGMTQTDVVAALLAAA